MRKPLLGMLTVMLVVGSLAAGGSAFGQTASGSRQLRAPTIVIDNDAYYPSMLRVEAGQTVAVTNREGDDHSLTARNGSFNTGIFSTGTRYITAPEQPGRYAFSCLVHGPRVMKGILIVEG